MLEQTSSSQIFVEKVNKTLPKKKKITTTTNKKGTQKESLHYYHPTHCLLSTYSFSIGKRTNSYDRHPRPDSIFFQMFPQITVSFDVKTICFLVLLVNRLISYSKISSFFFFFVGQKNKLQQIKIKTKHSDRYNCNQCAILKGCLRAYNIILQPFIPISLNLPMFSVHSFDVF